MNWHERYTQQARWTQDLRNYLFDKAGLTNASRILEVGCGTGAVLSSMRTPAALYGLDIVAEALTEAKIHTPGANLVRGDALSLPYPDFTFDITFCHFLLLWVDNPSRAAREMARVTRPGGSVLALAEPDYSQRVDKPESLAPLGKWQADALHRQGADPSFGARLAATFAQAGIDVIEAGTIQRSESETPRQDREIEWAVVEADLAGSIPDADLQKMKILDEKAWARGERVLYVPTYFAWGRV
jgi:ubiquinone/menaquinone biosynthesis C-methylase UbiE